MRRRNFLSVLGGAAAWPLAARAQQPALPVVGFFHIGSSNSFRHLAAAVRRGLADTDFFEGRHFAIEYRWGDGQADRLPALAADLLRRRPAVVVASRQAAQVLKDSATTTPVVFSTGDDPIKLGFVETINRPGRNMTGIYLFTAGLEGKRLGLLRDMVPTAPTMGVLVDSNHSFADDQFRGAQQAAQRLGIQVVRVNVSSDQELEPAFATLAEQGAKALLGCASLLFQDNRNRIVALAERYNMPGAYEDRGFVTAGGLMSYGNNLVDDYRELGHYAGLILKGANAGELPVVRPTKFQLVINVRTAKKLGINISDNFLTLADEVIE